MKNTDRAYIAKAISENLQDIALEMNADLRSLGARFVTGNAKKLELSFQVTETSTQGNGVVSGGTLVTMLDYTMAFAVLNQLDAGKTCATANINVTMLAAAKPNLLRVVAEVDRIGRNLAFSRSTLFDAEKKFIIATASATFVQMDEKN